MCNRDINFKIQLIEFPFPFYSIGDVAQILQ